MRGELPAQIAKFFEAHQDLVSALISECDEIGFDASSLKFSMDGKLLGDIGEWIAVRHYGMLLEGTNRKGVDGRIGCENVEVKATLRGDGVAFRYLEAEHRSPRLLVFQISADGRHFDTVYDGPHELALAPTYEKWESGKVKKTTQCVVRTSHLKAKQDELI